MDVPIIVAFFKKKVVRSLIILACWTPLNQVKFIEKVSEFGVTATISCDGSSLKQEHKYGIQGIVYYDDQNNTVLEKMDLYYFSNHYNWLIIGESVPRILSNVRYDSELTFLRSKFRESNGNIKDIEKSSGTFYYEDIHVHPSEGISIHPWAYWTTATGLVVTHNIEKIRRKLDLKGYPMRIASPVGVYSEDWYNGTYIQYVEDETLNELDAGIRCGYGASMLIIEALNATDIVVQCLLWSTMVNNSSMLLMLNRGQSELSGGILRIMLSRIELLDYIMPAWPFSVGFTYLAERESSSNMYVEPFTSGVWWTCLAIGLVLAIAQRITSRTQEEKDGSYYAVLATWLQQDASAVPKGISGRWTFLVLSLCSMLVHAYYTSAIVSALMSSGRSGPDSLRTLADSRYAIASEDYDYMRYLMFDVETNWEDMEYLKRKKLTSKFYYDLDRGVELIQGGNTAFHSEYNQIYPHFKSFTDDQICKLQHVDTIPESMTWITTTIRSQWTSVFRSTGAWLHEVGLAKRLLLKLRALRPACRSSLLAERVKFGDVAPLLGLTASGAILSLMLLGLEILLAKWSKKDSLMEITSNSYDGAVKEENDFSIIDFVE